MPATDVGVRVVVYVCTRQSLQVLLHQTMYACTLIILPSILVFLALLLLALFLLLKYDS